MSDRKDERTAEQLIGEIVALYAMTLAYAGHRPLSDRISERLSVMMAVLTWKLCEKVGGDHEEMDRVHRAKVAEMEEHYFGRILEQHEPSGEPH